MTTEAAPEVPTAPPPAPDRLPDIDLADSFYDAPVMRVPLARFTAGTLSNGEWAQVSRLSGIARAELASIRIDAADPEERALRYLQAIAYVLRLRIDPGFTWEDMQGYRLEVIGAPTVPPPMAVPMNGTIGSSDSRSRRDGPRP